MSSLTEVVDALQLLEQFLSKNVGVFWIGVRDSPAGISIMRSAV